MVVSLDAIRNETLTAIARQNIEIAADAWAPLGRIDFKKLVDIHDHEENFLRMTFVSNLVEAYRARVAENQGAEMITPDDVRTAMLMLGVAVAAANELAFSGRSKQVIRDVCPYC